MPSLTTFAQHSFGTSNHCNQSRKGNTRNSNWKKWSKIVTFANDIILHIKNPKCTIRKLLALINEFGKVAGYKINIQKSFAFLYINNERQERQINEIITFTVASDRVTCLVLNLSKETTIL